MARRGLPLREIRRLLNVRGDIQLGQEYEKKGDKAQRNIASLADKGTKAMSGDYKGEKFLEFAKFVTSFIPGAKPINMLLTAIDVAADQKKANKEIKAFEKLRPSGDGLYGDYESQNFDAIFSQVKQAQKASAKQSMLSGLMGIGIKSGITKGLSDPAQTALKTIFPQMALADMPTEKGMQYIQKGLGNVKKGMPNIMKGLQDKLQFNLSPRTKELFQGLGSKLDAGANLTELGVGDSASLMDPFLSETMGDPLSLSLQDRMTKMPFSLKMPSTWKSPALYDYFDFLQPKLQRGLRRGREATVPAAPHMRRPSIRRRIG